MFKYIKSQQLLSALFIYTVLSISAVAQTPGKVIGSTEVVIPEWFKDSFLSGRKLLFFQMNGDCRPF